MKPFLFLLIFSVMLAAQNDFSAEFGYNGFVPKVFKNKAAAGVSAKTVKLQQRALWLNDTEPNAFGGMTYVFLKNSGKLTWGGGWEWHYDWHDLGVSDVPSSAQPVSLRVFDQNAYGIIMLHLKQNWKASAFIGAKAGVSMISAGVSELVGSNRAIVYDKDGNAEKNDDGSIKTEDGHRQIPWQTHTPGLSASLLFGLRVPFFNKLFSRVKAAHLRFGMRITGEIFITTPSAKMNAALYKNISSGDFSVSGYNKNTDYRAVNDGLKAGVSFYVHFGKKNKITAQDS